MRFPISYPDARLSELLSQIGTASTSYHPALEELGEENPKFALSKAF
jgi:hypothetical protein